MFKIGEFSKLSQAPVTALRYYDEMGLLKPSRVDPFTGYRYYSIDQLPRLNRILAFKDLGFSLEQLAQLLDEPVSAAHIRGMLRMKRLEIQGRMEMEQARLARVEARLRQIEQEDRMRVYEVILKRAEPQTVAAIRQLIPAASEVGKLYYELETFLAKHHTTIAGYPLTIWHDPEYRERDFDAEVAIPVDAAMRGNDRVMVRDLPAVESVASVVYQGPYENISEAYSAIGKWIESNHYRITGPAREVYLRYGPTGVDIQYPAASLTNDSGNYVTEIQFPVAQV